MSSAPLPYDEVVDADHLLAQGNEFKDKATAAFKKKDYGAAQEFYMSAVRTLDVADGKPMLRHHAEAFVGLKSVLYANVAQCLLNKELYRQAADAATESLKFDPANSKACYRRALAYEKFHKYGEAIADFNTLKQGGGGGLSNDDIEKHITRLQAKKDEIDKQVKEQQEDDESDPIGMSMVEHKKEFDRIVEKYDLAKGDAAEQVADWLTSGEWDVTAKRIADRWKMEVEDAFIFMKWIEIGLDFQIKNSGDMANASPLAKQYVD